MGQGTNQITKIWTKNIDFHFLDLTVTFYAFDFNSYDCSPDEVNGGYRVVP